MLNSIQEKQKVKRRPNYYGEVTVLERLSEELYALANLGCSLPGQAYLGSPRLQKSPGWTGNEGCAHQHAGPLRPKQDQRRDSAPGARQQPASPHLGQLLALGQTLIHRSAVVHLHLDDAPIGPLRTAVRHRPCLSVPCCPPTSATTRHSHRKPPAHPLRQCVGSPQEGPREDPYIGRQSGTVLGSFRGGAGECSRRSSILRALSLMAGFIISDFTSTIWGEKSERNRTCCVLLR